MIYLSLFNGISAGRLASIRAGLKFDKYYVAEIDKWANKVSDHHYPDNIQLGDVTRWREWDIDWSQISLVTAGFPCQAWSMAGKQNGDKDPRGVLFWTMLDIISNVLKHNHDAKFMLENVKMKKEFEEYITHHTEQALGGVTKTLINSALVSAQNRNRYYWTNFEVPQPEEHGINVSDILVTPPEDGIVVREKSKTVRCGGRGSVDRHEWDSISKCHSRKYTVTECARLQTFPDGWCESVVSNTQAYKCYGNAWTVDVIAHILRQSGL